MNTRGFTLIEVLIALSVFAILASITSTAMYQAFNTREHITNQSDRLNTLQMAILLLKRDTQQIVERAVLGNEMHTFPPFIGQPHYIELTRGGVASPMGIDQGKTLQRVAFLCKNTQLYRRSWQTLDGSDRNHYQDRLLLDHLTQCQFSFVAHNKQVLPDWRAFALQQNQQQEILPFAIQLTLKLSDWGEMSMLLRLR
jgi:general secretion pathway protein J